MTAPCLRPMPDRAVTKPRNHINHGLHLFLTIFTFGIWGLCVWLPLDLSQDRAEAEDDHTEPLIVAKDRSRRLTPALVGRSDPDGHAVAPRLPHGVQHVALMLC